LNLSDKRGVKQIETIIAKTPEKIKSFPHINDDEAIKNSVEVIKQAERNPVSPKLGVNPFLLSLGNKNLPVDACKV
jgi:hypothetical protein